MKEDLAVIYANSFKENWTLSALTDYGDSGSTITYGDMAKRIARLHIFFESQGVRVGDKIALCGRNRRHGSLSLSPPSLTAPS